MSPKEKILRSIKAAINDTRRENRVDLEEDFDRGVLASDIYDALDMHNYLQVPGPSLKEAKDLVPTTGQKFRCAKCACWFDTNVIHQGPVVEVQCPKCDEFQTLEGARRYARETRALATPEAHGQYRPATDAEIYGPMIEGRVEQLEKRVRNLEGVLRQSERAGKREIRRLAATLNRADEYLEMEEGS